MKGKRYRLVCIHCKLINEILILVSHSVYFVTIALHSVAVSCHLKLTLSFVLSTCVILDFTCKGSKEVFQTALLVFFYAPGREACSF